MKDNMEYIDYATEYATAVVNGVKEYACKAERDACKRHLNDLKRADLEWRPDIAFKHCQFAEKLQVYNKNERCYKPLKLRGFQKFIICSLFGWYKNGIRRFTEAYVQEARKNGKSFLNAFLCLDFSSLSAIKDGQIFCTGTNYDNASIVWQDFKKMIEGNRGLGQFYKIKDYQDSRSKIINNKNNSVVRPLSGDTKKDGFLPYLACIDEYHLHETDEMYNVMLDGQVGLNGSLLAVITTAGKNLNGPCYRQYKYAKMVVSGAIEADNLFVYIAEIDLPDSHKDDGRPYQEALWNERSWAMANPYLLYDDDYHVTKDETKWKDFRDAGKKARLEEGSTLNNFLIKKLNVWTTVGSEFYVDNSDWTACGTDKMDITGQECYIGLDLSSKNDLSSLAFIFPSLTNYIFTHSFLPKGTLYKHIQTDKIPYDRLAVNGYLSLTDCNGTNAYIQDYRFIADYLKKFIRENKLQPKLLGYDAMGIGGIMQDLDEIPCEKVEIGQYPKSMNEATRHFKGTVTGHQMRYDKKNELLTYSICNAVATYNSKKEMLIDKVGVKNRIDPIDAVLDAWKCMLIDKAEMDTTAKDEATLDNWLQLMDKMDKYF